MWVILVVIEHLQNAVGSKYSNVLPNKKKYITINVCYKIKHFNVNSFKFIYLPNNKYKSINLLLKNIKKQFGFIKLIFNKNGYLVELFVPK